MKIDWKHLATTDGYKSLKAAYMEDIEEKNRSKKESICKFNWVISRAKHYSHKTGKSISAILNEWENGRDYWWLNYYHDCGQPKLHSNSMKRMGINGFRNYLIKQRFYESDPRKLQEQINQFTKSENKGKKSKPRWSIKRKKRGY